MFGPVRVLRAFLPLLEKSPAPVVLNVSSGAGSLSLPAGELTRSIPKRAQSVAAGATG